MKNKNKLGLSLMAVALLSVAVLAVTVMKSPTSCSGTWSTCSRAFADDALRATGSGNVATGIWQNYGFSIPAGDSIDSVVVRADFFASRTNGHLSVRVSGDGGASWGPAHVVGGNLVEQTFNIPVTGDLPWTPSKLNNANFRVEAKCIKVNSSKSVKCNLDWIPVTVTHHTPPPANETCIRANPTVLISPDSQSGTPGTKLTYITAVTNNDNANCTASTFDMSASVPSGWSSSFNPVSLVLNPGASGSTQFNITSATNSTQGNYTFTNTATNRDAPSFQRTDSAIYIVI